MWQMYEDDIEATLDWAVAVNLSLYLQLMKGAALWIGKVPGNGP